MPDFSNYTVQAKRAFFFARFDAGLTARDKIDPDHLFLGLMKADEDLFARKGLKDAGEKAYNAVRKRIPIAGRGLNFDDATLSGESDTVLNFAEQESLRLNHHQVGTDHLLLGMLKLDRLAEVLRKYGITWAGVNEQMQKATVFPANESNPLTIRSFHAYAILVEQQLERLELPPHETGELPKILKRLARRIEQLRHTGT